MVEVYPLSARLAGTPMGRITTTSRKVSRMMAAAIRRKSTVMTGATRLVRAIEGFATPSRTSG